MGILEYIKYFIDFFSRIIGFMFNSIFSLFKLYSSSVIYMDRALASFDGLVWNTGVSLFLTYSLLLIVVWFVLRIIHG